MPFIQRENGQQLYFDISGHKNSVGILTLHGWIENGAYWGRTGISARLAAKGFCVCDIDMRGHGKSFPGEAPDYSIEAMVEDISAVADYMGFEKFHLLTHATGGMVGCRYAITHPERLLSMIASDTSASTALTPEYASADWDDKPIPKLEGNPGAMNKMWLMTQPSYAHMMQELSTKTNEHPLGIFFQGFLRNAEPERCWRWTEEIYDSALLKYGADFAEGFMFNDQDRYVEKFRKLDFPVLAMAGELDYALVPFTEAIARCIPGAKLHIFQGLGHMTAIEDPDATFEVIMDFLEKI